MSFVWIGNLHPIFGILEDSLRSHCKYARIRIISVRAGKTLRIVGVAADPVP